MAKNYKQVLITPTGPRKGITFDQYPDEAWVWFAGKPEDGSDPKAYFKEVPWLYRGISKIAGKVASVPFAILDSAGNEVDGSEDWKNVVEFLPHPRRLIWLATASLTRSLTSISGISIAPRRVSYLIRHITP